MTLVNPILTSALIQTPSAKKEMISVSHEGDKTHVRINSSSILLIQECMRKAKYSLLEGWRAENEAPATLFGSAIHAALEEFYKTKPDERRLPKMETLEIMSYGNKVEGEETDPLLRSIRKFLEKGRDLSGLPEGDKRSLQNGTWLLHEYFKKFLDYPYTAYCDSFGPFLERTFTLPYIRSPKLSVDLFGTIDFCLEHVVTRDRIPGDHKTTSSFSFGDSNYFDREKPNHQYTIYSLAARSLFGINTDDFLVSIFEVKQRPKTARGSGPSFPQQITKRTQEDYEELEDVIKDVVERYLHALERNVWPLGSVDACNKYGSCGFKNVCSAPRGMRETILKGKYTQ